MHIEKQDRYNYQAQNDYPRNNQTQNPRTNRYNRLMNYQTQRGTQLNVIPNLDMGLEMQNDENLYKPNSLIQSLRNNNNVPFLPQLGTRFGEERDPSPKTINVGDTKETLEYNIKTLNPKRSPQYFEDTYPQQDMNNLDINDSEPRNGSFDGRKYYGQNNQSYIERERERSPNYIINRNSENNTSINIIDKNGVLMSGNVYNGPKGGRINLDRQGSPYQNFEEMNTSNDVERFGSEERKNRTIINEYIPNRLDNNTNNTYNPQINNLRNINNYSNSNLNNYQNVNGNNIAQYHVNTINMKQDEIQEKYVNKTYDNMTYKDVKKIVRRFTKVYDPNKNSNGLLVEESQITLPGANDEVFNNRYRVLSKMNRLSNILLSKQRRSTAKRFEDYYNNYITNTDRHSGYNSDENNIKTYKTFNRQSFEKRGRSPLKLANRRSPENKFKYVSLAMISSKRLRTEDRIILRKMRFEKGGVVDLAQERKRGKYKIRKVSRSPGYKHNFFRTNPKYREIAAKYIQKWWRLRKENYEKTIKKIIKIQSVYRGRFVRKYLYDLLYLNYLYLSFCQKIEKVLKQQIKPYVFNFLKNYGKIERDEIDFNILKNIVASKAKKWKIINLRRYYNKWKKFLKTKEKLILTIYKIIKVRAEKENRNSLVKDALRKWNYIVKSDKMLQKLEEDKRIIIEKTTEIKEIEEEKNANIEEEKNKIIRAKEEASNKIKGLLQLLNGIKGYTKKTALEPTLPKLIYYLSNEYLNKILKKIISRKINDEKEKLKYYFYKYIKMTLKYIKNRINELPNEIEEQENIIFSQIEPIKKQVKEQRLQILTKRPVKKTKITHEEAMTIKKSEEYEINKREEKIRIEKLIIEKENKKNKEISLMKARIFLHLINCIKDKQNKKLLGKYFRKYFKKVIQMQRKEDRKLFEEEQRKQYIKIEKERRIEEEREEQREREREIERRKEEQREKERQKEREREEQRERERQKEREKDKQREKERKEELERQLLLEKEIEKDKDKLLEYQELIEKYKLIIKEKEMIIDSTKQINEDEIYERAVKELLDKIEACQLIQKFVFRNTHKYPLYAFDDKLSDLRKNHLLIKIVKTNNRVKQYNLRKYFNIWRNKTFDKYKKETTRNTFLKILSIITDNSYKRLLRKKLYQWRSNAYALKEEEEKEIIKEEYKPNIFKTLKIIKDIISFNDYLRDITVHKYGNTFLYNLDKTRNPLLKKKYLKKFVKIKIIREKGLLRRAFNKWKNNVDIENAIQKLRTKLMFFIYDKNRNINENNALQKYFNRWKNINKVEKIKTDINILKQTQNKTKVVTIKTIIKNKNKNKQKDILKKYLNKWINVLKSEKPLLREFFKKITKINIYKNGPEFLDRLNIERIYNKKMDLLLKIIPKRLKNEKMLLYKYLLRWRNKIYGINNTNNNIIHGEKIISLIINKNNKEKLLKAFNRWRYGKGEKIPINAYIAAIKKIRNAICRKPYLKFVTYMDKTNPKKLRPKALKVIKIFTKIIKEKPFNHFFKNIKTSIRVNELKKVQPKIHDITKKYYLLKYFNRWKNNAQKTREKNMKIITNWLKKKYDIEKDRRQRRRYELLKRIILNLIKEYKHRLRFPFNFWKRIAMIYKDNENARIIQNFCRKILLRRKKRIFDDKKKLADLLVYLYRKTIIRTVTDQNDVGEVNKYLNTKKKNIRKLINIFKNRDKYNNRLLLRLAFLKWNEGKDKYDRSIQIIQNKIRQLISKNKLNDKRLLLEILKHIVKNNEYKNKNLLRNKFLQWYAIAKKLNYHDTSKIEEFIRKIVVERLRRKLQTLLNRYTNKYFIYLLNNIAKFYILRKILRKEPLKDAFYNIKNHIRKKVIKNSLHIIVKDKDDNLKRILLREYLNKWRNKVKDIKNKEKQSVVIIQKIFRGKKAKKDVNRERIIKKILTELVYRYDENSPLHLYFAKWKRITKKIILDENARIIQNFCRQIHSKYLKMQDEKITNIYKKLANVLVKIGKNPKRDVFYRLYIIYRNNILNNLLDNLNRKRKVILKDAFDNIRNYTRIVVLRNNLEIKENHRNRILKKYLIKWRNLSLRDKYIILYLTKFIKKIEHINDNLLRSILYTWLYKAHLRLIKEKEIIISEFCKEIARKNYIYKRWQDLANKLRHIVKSYDIEEIRNQLKYLIGLNKINKMINRHYIKDAFNKLNRIKKITTFKKKVTIIINNIDKDNKEISIKKYFDIWRDKTTKITHRLQKLDDLMKILGIKQIRDDATTLYYVFLIKKIIKNIPKLYLINAFYKIKRYADSKIKNEKLANDLIKSENDIKIRRVTPLITKIYKIYAYKVIENLFNILQKGLKRQSLSSKYDFLKKMIIHYSNYKKEYKYSHKIQNENKPYTKRILFKTKKKVEQKITKDKSQIYLSLTSMLVELIDNMIKKNKKNTFDTIKKKYMVEKLVDALHKYARIKVRPSYEEFLERLRILIDMYENDGPQQAKLFKLLRKIIIKKLFVYKEEVYRINKLFYLINLTTFNKEKAKNRWIRQIIRKWRFISFMKKITRKKMQLMYKNLHGSYLEMVNTLFSDEEKKNPSVVKEFERFGYNVGMFINENPFNTPEEKMCLEVKKTYIFQNDLDKVLETKKKVVKKEIREEEKYFSKAEYEKDMDTKSRNKKYGIHKSREYDYDNTGSRYDGSSSIKDDKDNKSKYKPKLKTKISTEPKSFNESEFEEDEKEEHL